MDVEIDYNLQIQLDDVKGSHAHAVFSNQAHQRT